MIPTQQETAESRYISWSAPQFSRTIEYPREVLEQIRAYGCNELSRLSHGGRDVGGILFGLELPGIVRILMWRPIVCEYADGESLRLSHSDRMNLAVQLEAARSNPELKELRPVGWFVSHPRGDIAMTADDLETFGNFFPSASQVTLVICPQEEGRAEAGFFFRESDGTVRSEASFGKLTLEPIHPTPGPQEARTAPAPAPKPDVAPPPLPVPEFQVDEPLPGRDRLLWAVPIALALGLAAWVLYQRQKPAEIQPLAFRIAASAGRSAELAWDANSHAVRNAERGELAVTDGGKSTQVALSSDQLRAGKMTYVAQSGDAGFELIVYSAGGSAVHESTRLVAPALAAEPAASPAATSATQQQDELQQQVRQLKQQLGKERARADELQNLVRILEARLGVQTGAQP